MKDRSKYAEQIAWKRLTELSEQPAMYAGDHGGVEPSDIIQGNLEDSWLTSSIACVAASLELIKCLLVQDKTDVKLGKFTFRLFESYTGERGIESAERSAVGRWGEAGRVPPSWCPKALRL